MERSKADYGILLELVRVAKGLKASEVADQGGMTRSALSAWEGGKTPRWENLERLLATMGVPYAALDEAEKFLARIRSLEATTAEPPAPYGADPHAALQARAQRALASFQRGYGELLGVYVELQTLLGPASGRGLDRGGERGR